MQPLQFFIFCWWPHHIRTAIYPDLVFPNYSLEHGENNCIFKLRASCFTPFLSMSLPVAIKRKYSATWKCNFPSLSFPSLLCQLFRHVYESHSNRSTFVMKKSSWCFHSCFKALLQNLQYFLLLPCCYFMDTNHWEQNSYPNKHYFP